jgi:hypothetical protein
MPVRPPDKARIRFKPEIHLNNINIQFPKQRKHHFCITKFRVNAI